MIHLCKQFLTQKVNFNNLEMNYLLQRLLYQEKTQIILLTLLSLALKPKRNLLINVFPFISNKTLLKLLKNVLVNKILLNLSSMIVQTKKRLNI